MKTIKLLAMLIGFSLMSTGCNHDHSHEEKPLKKEKSNQSQGDEKAHGSHRH